MRAHPVGVALDAAPKYVASATLTDPRWANTTVLSGDLAVAIGELKAKPAGELQAAQPARLPLQRVLAGAGVEGASVRGPPLQDAWFRLSQ